MGLILAVKSHPISKCFFILWLGILGLLLPSSKASAAVDGLRVTQVTFYPTAALIIKEGVLRTDQDGVLDLGYLPASAIKDSVSLQLSSPFDYSEVRIQGVKNDPDLERLKEQLEQLKIKLDSLKAQRSFLTGLLNTAKVQGKSWWQGLSFKQAIKRLNEITTALEMVNRKLGKVKRQTTKVEQAIKKWRQEHKWHVSAYIGKPAASVQVQLSFRDNSAYWRPVYIAKLKAEAISLAFKARLHQATGQDWRQVRAILSTAEPRGRVNPPEPRPIYLRPLKHKIMLRAVGSSMKVLKEGMVEDKMEELAPSYKELEGVALYTITSPISLASGKGLVVAVDKWSLPADIKRFCYPAVDTNVYIMAEISSLPRLLPPGRVYLYQGNSWVGEFYLRARPHLALSFGRDQGIRVKRKQVKRFLDRKFGGKVEIYLTYRITLTNISSSTKTVEVEDRIPVSQDERIRVYFKGAQPATQPEESTGFLKWNVKIPPKGKKVIEFSFSVKYPEKMEINHPF